MDLSWRAWEFEVGPDPSIYFGFLHFAGSFEQNAGGDGHIIEDAKAPALVGVGVVGAASHVDSHTFDQISQDATEIVKENPWQSVGVVFIVGLLLGMLFGGGRD